MPLEKPSWVGRFRDLNCVDSYDAPTTLDLSLPLCLCGPLAHCLLQRDIQGIEESVERDEQFHDGKCQQGTFFR